MANFKISLILFLIVITCCYCSSRECLELTEFECKDGSCIKTENVCNRRKDCSNGEDEKNCEYRLCEKPNWYRCADNKTCISSGFLCDKLEHCPSGDDEDNCEKTHQHRTCNKFEFTCTDKTCIPLDMVCDGKYDCSDKSDETTGCTEIQSRCKAFLCKNKRCLESHNWVCDGYDDCGDGSDEVGCTNNCKLEDRKFLCKDNDSCIPISKVCDGKEDCIDKSDEHEMCQNHTTQCINSTLCLLPSECIMLPSGPICICPKGFYFNSTRKRCSDVNECEIFGICSQGCNNTEGSYICTCDDKFTLKNDNKTCEAKGGEPLLLYTTQKTVVGVYLKSRHMYPVAKNLSQVIGVSYDGLNIYWTDIKHNEESIVKAREDGSKQEILLTSGLEAPEDLAIDWLTGNIYFTDNMMKHIAVCSNNGYICTSLVVENVDQPRGIALYPKKGMMYWTDWGRKPMIAKASMDGVGALALVDTEIHWPNGVTLDIPANRLYWVDAKFGRIETVFLDGTDRRIILSDILKHPYGIAVFGNTIYWSDWGTKSIHSCHKFTGKHHDIVAKDRTIYDIHIYHSAIQPKSDHPCLKHKCSHLCLLAANNSSTCTCPEGMMLSVDQLTCKRVAKKQRLYMGLGNFLVEMEHTAFGRHKAAESVPLSLYIHKMTYNSLNGTIFIADNVQRIIYEYNISTKSANMLVSSNIGNISALSFDHFSNNLYWSDSDRHTIEVISLTNRQRAIIHHFSGTDIPISMIAIPEAGKMFIALRSESYTHIDVQPLHGRSNHHHVVEDKIGSASIQLFVDSESETVFWLDSASGKIEFTNYEGSFRHLFRSRLKAPSYMTVIDEDVMWSSHKSPSIYWTHKSNLGSIKKFDLDNPPYMSFPDDIPLISSKPLYVVDHPCQHNNGDCSHICVSMGKLTSACLCPPGLVFKDNRNMTCIDALDCEFRCRSGECLTSSRRCNGRKDCADRSDEEGCELRPSGGIGKTCSYDQFSCHDGTQCVSNQARCDKVVDCKDKSDEDDCERFDHEKKCREHQHACANGRCVDITVLCDSFNDCGDNSDENSCGKSEDLKICGKNMFTCISGQCIPKGWECDAHMDCVDGSDEHEKCSSTECPKGSTKCKMGQCIDTQLVCDGHNDCGDNSDEFECSKKMQQISCDDDANNSSDSKKFQCPSNPSLCLDIKVRCNGTAECPRGEDEVGCSGCSFYEFQCQNDKSCIRREFRCDKQKDCSDGSDEVNCQYYNASYHHQFATMCQDDMFDCGDGTCIEQLRICDDTPDCKNGQDESPICKTACINSYCEHKCSSSPYGAICSCRNGYRINSNKKTCHDINECAESNPCAQTCENTEGSYRCGCFGGFLLRSDKTSCKSIEAEHYLLFSSYNQVRKLSENPYLLKILWSLNDSRIIGIDVDARNKNIYYTVQDSEAIYEYNSNSITRKELKDPGMKEKIAVDWVTGNVYVIDYSGYYSIKVCSFEKSVCSKVIGFTNKEKIKALAVDAVNKFLFYSVVNSSTFDNPQTAIYRAGLDGSRKELILSKPVYANALECDTYKKQLYFIDTHSKTLQSISYQGGTSKIIIRRENTIINPSGLTVFENVAFIINTGSPEAVKCQLYGENTCKAFNLNVYNAEDIVVVAPSRQKKVYNICEKHRCSFICVQAELGSKCLCQDGRSVQIDVQCDNEKDIFEGTEEIIEKNQSSRGPLAVFLVFIVIILVVIFGYMYYRRRTGQGNFNINMHFQNPLSYTQQNTNIDNTESTQVKMCRPLQRLWQGGRVSNLSEISVYSKRQEGKVSTGEPENNRNATEDSDDESERDVGNFRDDPWSCLVK